MALCIAVPADRVLCIAQRWSAWLALVALGSVSSSVAAPSLVAAQWSPGAAILRPDGDAVPDAVVALLDVAGRLACSGVMIRSRVALTAAHCISLDGAQPHSLYPEAQLVEGGGFYSVVERIPHPDFDAGLLRADLALVAVSGAFDAQPLGLSNRDLDDDVQGVSVRVAGYGCTDLEGESGGGLRRGQQDVVVGYHMDSKLRHGASTCRGDSGGPLLAREDGDTRVLAISSSGGNDGEEFAVAIPVAPYRDWIEAEADRLQERTGATSPVVASCAHMPPVGGAGFMWLLPVLATLFGRVRGFHVRLRRARR